MYDALAAHSAHITTIIEGGYSASAATIIFMAGDKRKISENALFLIHKSLISPWDWSFNENALKDLLEDVRATDKRLRAIYEKAGVSTTDVEELMNAQYGNGKWIDAQEAGPAPDGYGFATEIVEARGLMTASATSKSRHLRLNKQGLPPLPPTPVVKHSNKHKKSKRMSKNKSLFDQVKDYFSNNQVEKTEEEIEQGLGNMSARIEELEASEKKLQNENTDLQSQIDNLKQEKSALEADLEAQSKALTAAKEDLQKEVETAKTTHEETIKAKDKEIQNLTKERDDLNAKFEKQKGGKTVVDGGSDPSLVNTPKSDNEAAYEDNVAYFEKMTGSK
jgi:phage shock protein A